MFKNSIPLSVAAIFMSCTAALAGGLASAMPDEPVMVPLAPADMAGSWYGALSLGYMPESTADGVGDLQFTPFQQDVAVDFDAGQMLSLALGYEYASGLRVEAEALYLQGESNSLEPSLAQGAIYDFIGDFAVTAGMVNAWYSFGDRSIRPFVGGGIGLANVSLDVPAPTSPPPNGVDDSDTSFAWQIGAGVDFAMSDNMSFVAAYRVLNISDIEMTDSANDDFNVDWQTQAVSAGIRFKF